MNHSLYSADRATHLKVVVAALLVAIAVSGLSLALHFNGRTEPANQIIVSKAGKPTALTSSTITLTR